MTMATPPNASLPQVPNAPAPPPMFGNQQSPGAKPKRASFFPTFLGSGDIPQGTSLGQKTLLGGTQ